MAALNPIHCTYNVRSLSSIFLNFSKYFSGSSFFQLLNACQKLFSLCQLNYFLSHILLTSQSYCYLLHRARPLTAPRPFFAPFFRCLLCRLALSLLRAACPWHGAGQLMGAVFRPPVIRCLPLYRILSACQGSSAIRTHFFETKQGKLSLSAVCFFVLYVFCAVFPFRMSKPHNRKGANDANPSALLLYFSVFVMKSANRKKSFCFPKDFFRLCSFAPCMRHKARARNQPLTRMILIRAKLC